MAAEREAALDLEACERIPVHAPGTVQDGYTLLLFDPMDGGLAAAGGDLEALFGAPAERLLGAGPERFFGPEDAALVAEALGAGMAPQARPVSLASGRTLWASPVAAGPLVGLELEAAPETAAIHRAGDAFAAASAALGRIVRRMEGTAEDAVGRDGAIILACFQRLTGHDRALIHVFDADLNGRVVADSRAGQPDSLLDLRFPASDIPGPARQMFRRNPLRMIADTGGTDWPLVQRDRNVEIDLADCVGRGVAEVHRHYLRAMGVKASLSLALMVNGALWGIVALHDRTGPLRIDPARRAMARALADILAGGIGTAEAHSLAKARQTAQATADRLVAAARSGTDPADADAGLLDAMGCDGLVFHGRRGSRTLGRVPDVSAQEALESRIGTWLEGFGRDRFVTNRTVAHWPDLAPHLLPHGAGVVRIGRTGEGVWLTAFRRARRLSEDWAGDPGRRADLVADGGMAAPQRSFAAWRAKVSDHALPWPAGIVEVGQILLAGLAEAEAIRDPAPPAARMAMPGLADRAGLSAALRGRLRGTVAVLRMDAPDGSPAADRAMAAILMDLAQEGDLPGRLEQGRFALVCTRTTDANALTVRADRFQAAAGADPGGALFPVGIARAEAGGDPEALLLEAEIALHGSRVSAGGRPVHFAPSMAQGFAAARRWDAAVSRTLAGNGAAVHYQPVVDATTLKVREVTAALRLTDPQGGTLTLDGTPPPCTDPALNRRLDVALLEDVATRHERWTSGGRRTLPIGIAVPAARLREGDLARSLAALPFRRDLIVTLRDIGGEVPDEVLRWAVESVHDAGARIELAGFGAACAPLSALVRMRPDRLRLDAGIVSALTRSETALTLAETLVGVGESLGVPVAADGVETLEQAAILRDLGCTLLRGPAFAAAVEPVRIPGLILSPPWGG